MTLWVLSDASMHNKCRTLSSVAFFCNNCQAHMNNRSCKCGNMHNLEQLDGFEKPTIIESESVGFDIM